MAKIYRTLKDTHTGCEKRNFNVRDSKGRMIGGSVSLYTRTVGDVHTLGSGGYVTPQAEGIYYGFCPHALRDGNCYGASHGWTWFSTEAERAAGVEKYFADASKRAQKKAQKKVSE